MPLLGLGARKMAQLEMPLSVSNPQCTLRLQRHEMDHCIATVAPLLIKG
ncbi:hypothetical protein APY04_3146 [Hyphomicrobium sulfonivorans]|uniref:Uncharacterized protein n=1 Tax=Hyphomicrobium sulfonivorans TaxID=121290 RepID=A0A109B9R7_HYPSL|nr:hypothetical protein APY04_3146 [Hyphomicrobium sulfonivorans]